MKLQENGSTVESLSFSEAGNQLTNYPLQILHIGRPSMDGARRSVTDMSLGGMQTPHRGFDFASEEGGVHMRRIQSNLSERRQRTLDSRGGEKNVDSHQETGVRRTLFPSLRQSVRRKMRLSHKGSKLPPSPPEPTS
jgi:phospholipid-translocating ATPase